MKKNHQYLLIFAIIALIVLPAVFNKHAEFTGTDDKAVSLIQHMDKGYQSWFSGIKLFQNEQLISIFFSFQAAIGAGIIGYYFGYSRGKRANEKK